MDVSEMQMLGLGDWLGVMFSGLSMRHWHGCEDGLLLNLQRLKRPSRADAQDRFFGCIGDLHGLGGLEQNPCRVPPLTEQSTDIQHNYPLGKLWERVCPLLKKAQGRRLEGLVAKHIVTTIDACVEPLLARCED